jgi:hypothetical protein
LDPSRARETLIERQRGFFDLQIFFAERLSAIWGQPLGRVALNWTNLHRRLALGTPDPERPAPTWTAFATGLEAQTSHAGRLEFSLDALKRCPEPPPPADQTSFGCFACEAPDSEGSVHIHFHNRDSDDEGGPLCRAKAPRRIAELRALTLHASADPTARRIVGGSWLYNVEAYRRLFPVAYVDSLQSAGPLIQMRGLSMWGQFLTHRGDLLRDLADRVIVRLGRLDPASPESAFPFRKLLANAPITTFQERFVSALPGAP